MQTPINFLIFLSFLFVYFSSPTLSHSFLLLIIIPLLVFMVLVVGRHRREEMEEEDSGHTHIDPMYDEEEGFEGKGDAKGTKMQGGKLQ